MAQSAVFLREHQLAAQYITAAEEGVALLPASVRHIRPSGALSGNQTHWKTGIAWNPYIKDPLRDNFLNVVLTPDK